MAREADRAYMAAQGIYGTDVLEGPGTFASGPWVSLQADTKKTHITELVGNWTGTPGELSKGETITGLFCSVTISEGSLIAKRAADNANCPIHKVE